MDTPHVKPLRWVGSSQDDLKEFPKEVRRVMGTALYLAQAGGRALDAKPLTGIVKGAGVLVNRGGPRR
jgi:phage-related protein